MKLLRTLLVTIFLCGAAMPAFAGQMVKSTAPMVVEPDKAMVVFMRPGKLLGRAIEVPVWDVTSGEPRFVGFVDAGKKVAYPVAPGEHIFMTTVFGGDAGVRFQKAHVEAGKVYYFRAHIIDQIWGLDPVRGSALGTSEFLGWDKGTSLTENSDETLAWGQETLPEAQRKSSLRPAVIAYELTLRADDGR